jgi:hypothetical protein
MRASAPTTVLIKRVSIAVLSTLLFIVPLLSVSVQRGQRWAQRRREKGYASLDAAPLLSPNCKPHANDARIERTNVKGRRCGTFAVSFVQTGALA